MNQQTTFTHDISASIDNTVFGDSSYDRIFVLVDANTKNMCLPLIEGCTALQGAHTITIGDTDTCKTLETVTHVWSTLSNNGCTRHSCLLNLGGGMLTDVGGFAAATFKRGISFVNIPTTLLAMVDASTGGKTGINFNGLKNEIGVFQNAEAVIICTDFLKTLDCENLCSGFAEMLKHSLLSSKEIWARHLSVDLNDPDFKKLSSLIEESVNIKKSIVEQDPHELGIRKALNFGHTIGHALESFSISRGTPVLHGYAVAWGIVCELYLSTVLSGFPTTILRQTMSFIRENYGRMLITCDDYEQLYSLMQHDKKNTGNRISFTLLSDIGSVNIDCHAPKELVFEAFDFYRES